MKEKAIPYFAYEAEMTKYERKTRRLWISILIGIGMIAGSNIIWFLHFFS